MGYPGKHSSAQESRQLSSLLSPSGRSKGHRETVGVPIASEAPSL